MKEVFLTQLPVGKSAKIFSLNAQGRVRRRLLDLGFIPGARVENVRCSPSGNPTAYLIKGTVIALRQEEADKLIIQLD